jgi:hypothetical protein
MTLSKIVIRHNDTRTLSVIMVFVIAPTSKPMFNKRIKYLNALKIVILSRMIKVRLVK